MTNDKQRDRLVELLEEAREKSREYFRGAINKALAEKKRFNSKTDVRSYIDVEADYLLANGVIVPPCKVGEHVWYFDIESRELVEGKVDGYLWFRSCGFALNVIWEKPIMGHFSYCRKEMPFSEVGKTVFLSREEAEAKLKEGASDEVL